MKQQAPSGAAVVVVVVLVVVVVGHGFGEQVDPLPFQIPSTLVQYSSLWIWQSYPPSNPGTQHAPVGSAVVVVVDDVLVVVLVVVLDVVDAVVVVDVVVVLVVVDVVPHGSGSQSVPLP